MMLVRELLWLMYAVVLEVSLCQRVLGFRWALTTVCRSLRGARMAIAGIAPLVSVNNIEDFNCHKEQGWSR